MSSVLSMPHFVHTFHHCLVYLNAMYRMQICRYPNCFGISVNLFLFISPLKLYMCIHPLCKTTNSHTTILSISITTKVPLSLNSKPTNNKSMLFKKKNKPVSLYYLQYGTTKNMTIQFNAIQAEPHVSTANVNMHKNKYK